jgi:hypothetical protein
LAGELAVVVWVLVVIPWDEVVFPAGVRLPGVPRSVLVVVVKGFPWVEPTPYPLDLLIGHDVVLGGVYVMEELLHLLVHVLLVPANLLFVVFFGWFVVLVVEKGLSPILQGGEMRRRGVGLDGGIGAKLTHLVEVVLELP